MKSSPESNISLEEIREDIQKHVSIDKDLPHKVILSKLLDKIEKVDFRNLVDLNDENEALKKKHYLVASIEYILEIARKHEWGLCRNHDFIYLYNGAYWDLLDEDELKTFLGEAVEKMSIDKYDARHYSFRDQLYKQFLALANLPKKERSTDSVLINLKNGTFEINSNGMLLREFRREDFITYQLPFEYNPKASSPLWLKFLEEAIPEEGKQKVLSEYLGYVFAKDLKLEKCLILYGPGGNGKSVFFDVVNALFGNENISSYSLQSLTNENGYSRAKLANKLLNYASEINVTLEASIFKQLVSGEPVEARLPYGDPFILTNYARLLFNCNQLPKNVEHTNAFFRRFLIIAFDKIIPEEKQDKDLAKKIISSELSGVFNWLLSGLNRLIEQRNFTKCDSITSEVEKFKTLSNTVRLFLQEEKYELHHQLYTSLKDLYNEYRSFCIEDGYTPVSKKIFQERLSEAKIPTSRLNIGNVVYVTKKLVF